MRGSWVECHFLFSFATDCPCGVWCRGLTTCLLHVGPPFGNPFFKQQFVCRFDIMDSISSIFCILTYAIIYVLLHHIIFRRYLCFLKILYIFKYTCTNIFHRRSLYTFYNMAWIFWILSASNIEKHVIFFRFNCIHNNR